jgi:hypothetical protein
VKDVGGQILGGILDDSHVTLSDLRANLEIIGGDDNVYLRPRHVFDLLKSCAVMEPKRPNSLEATTRRDVRETLTALCGGDPPRRRIIGFGEELH